MLDWLKIRIVQIIDWFADLFVAVFSALWDLISDAVSWTLDVCLGFAVDMANSINLGGLDGYNPGAGLPEEIINVLQLLGIGTCVSIIGTAITIRLVLQLIPFTRLGS